MVIKPCILNGNTLWWCKMIINKFPANKNDNSIFLSTKKIVKTSLSSNHKSHQTTQYFQGDYKKKPLHILCLSFHFFFLLQSITFKFQSTCFGYKMRKRDTQQNRLFHFAIQQHTCENIRFFVSIVFNIQRLSPIFFLLYISGGRFHSNKIAATFNCDIQFIFWLTFLALNPNIQIRSIIVFFFSFFFVHSSKNV